MADWTAGIKAQLKGHPKDWDAFRAWVKRRYPTLASKLLSQANVDFNKGLLAQNPTYRAWQFLGEEPFLTMEEQKVATTQAKIAAVENQPLLDQVNFYRDLLGEGKVASLDQLGKTDPEAYLTSLKQQWKNTLPKLEEEPSIEPPTPTPTPTPTPETATIPTTGFGEVRVETINGVLGVARYQDGVMTDFNPIPSTTTQRDWTPETLALEREKFAWTKSQAEAELARQPELQRQQMEREYEKDRQKLIEGLPTNDWVRRFFVANQPNPYKAQDTAATSFADLEKLLDKQTGRAQALEQVAMNRLLGGGSQTEAYQKAVDELEQAQVERNTTYKLWKGAKDESRDWTSQIYPNAPEWLPYYVPGVTAGKMITPQEVPIPSGQQLTAMPTNLLESLASYSKWAGGQMWRPLSDEVRRIKEAAALMQPETPRGAGRFGWSPAGR